DPWETTNVADDPAYAGTLAELRAELDVWVEGTGDLGQYPESEESLDRIRREYVERLADRLGALGIERVDQLYEAWQEHLRPTE
ncbi:MAG: arylsulfatase, partial [bacterium]|nr:arylsulfatase [bacterium]